MTIDRPVLSFIIPVRNDAERLRRCLASLIPNLSAVPSEVIVADNGSTDRTAGVAQESGARVLTVSGRPVSEVRNVAAAAAHGDFLAFIDADHELAPTWARDAVNALANPSVVAAGAQYHAPHPATWVQQMYDSLRRHRIGIHDVHWLPSGNLAVRRSAFERVGGFDVMLETCEDVDLCRRLRFDGGRVVAVDTLRSIHYGDPRSLKALFFGELWRGRDNLRVTLREPSVHTLPSLLFPASLLFGLVAIAVGSFALALGEPRILVGGIATVGALWLVRTAMLIKAPREKVLGAREIFRMLSFGLVFDTARALALVMKAGHSTRRKG